MSHISGFTKSEITSWALKHLNHGSLVISDGLKCFPGVKESACDHETIITTTDSGYDEFKVFKWINTMIANIKNAIHGTYHAVSENHLPRYLAEFCYRFNCRFQLEEMVNRFA